MCCVNANKTLSGFSETYKSSKGEEQSKKLHEQANYSANSTETVEVVSV